MKRSQPIRRTALKRGTTPLQRATRLSYRSKRREEDAAERTIVRERVFARDGWRCQMPNVLAAHGNDRDTAGRCMGVLTFHHIRKASQGGAYSESNGLSLCAAHNDWIETHPDAAYVLGLVKRHGDD